jgi:ribosomal protein L37E
VSEHRGLVRRSRQKEVRSYCLNCDDGPYSSRMDKCANCGFSLPQPLRFTRHKERSSQISQARISGPSNEDSEPALRDEFSKMHKTIETYIDNMPEKPIEQLSTSNVLAIFQSLLGSSTAGTTSSNTSIALLAFCCRSWMLQECLKLSSQSRNAASEPGHIPGSVPSDEQLTIAALRAVSIASCITLAISPKRWLLATRLLSGYRISCVTEPTDGGGGSLNAHQRRARGGTSKRPGPYLGGLIRPDGRRPGMKLSRGFHLLQMSQRAPTSKTPQAMFACWIQKFYQDQCEDVQYESIEDLLKVGIGLVIVLADACSTSSWTTVQGTNCELVFLPESMQW